MGKECLQLLHKNIIDLNQFPCHPSVIQNYGTVEAYLAFLSGQRSVISYIEQQINTAKNEV